MPVGGRTAIKANLRIIAATHRDLRQLVSQALFREDLFYRLNVVPLRLPPLRERTEDIPPLVHHFLGRARSEGLPLKTIEPDAMSRLTVHHWPGNVRELENMIRRLCVLYAQETIGADVVDAELREGAPGSMLIEGDGGEDLGGAVARHLDLLFKRPEGGLPQAGLHGRVVREVERPLIAKVLAATRGNQLQAAAVLGLNRNTLRKKIRELDIQLMRGPR
jgi:two-component system nitrogen regulation response regulator GlnG